MPHTWNASHIQFLTQPELRALFRVITRRRDRALFLVAYLLWLALIARSARNRAPCLAHNH